MSRTTQRIRNAIAVCRRVDDLLLELERTNGSREFIYDCATHEVRAIEHGDLAEEIANTLNQAVLSVQAAGDVNGVMTMVDRAVHPGVRYGA